ncbi:MAG: hypothetical protein MI922_28840 [Bacteroidales bacterium]|nr:hypothetical protein [Bacteroidales bacterium]
MKNILLLIAIVFAASACNSGGNLDKIQGKWLRPDGNYVLEIKEVLPGGKLRAAYYNPSDIKISKATYSEDKGTIKVHVEFADENYHGSKYNLVYDAKLDMMKGVYYQAMMGQTYEINFVRKR